MFQDHLFSSRQVICRVSGTSQARLPTSLLNVGQSFDRKGNQGRCDRLLMIAHAANVPRRAWQQTDRRLVTVDHHAGERIEVNTGL